jgi:transposase-like protein
MDELRMSTKERIFLDALKRVKRKEITVVKASELMNVSLRQARRIWKRFSSDGDVGLVHRLRGRVSNRRLKAEIGQRIVKRHQERYADFGPTLACEKLAEEGLVVSANTLTRLLKGRGLWERRRSRGKHRKRRERRSSFGSMVQMDGSHHDWFEGRGPWCVLMVMIDDATNITSARFYPAETTQAAFDVTGRWIKSRGVPRSIYVDRHSIYRDQDHPDKPTQFGRAMNQLGVKLIQAHSPQAKGRVERRNAVFQDRLVKELRLRGINTITGANALLDEMFLADLNRRYAVKPADETDLHRALGEQVDLADVLCVIESRVVGNDWCVRWNNRWLQIDKKHANLQLPRKKVTVLHRADGTLVVDHQSTRLRTTELKSKPQPAKKARTVINNRRWKPPASHPWRKGLEERAAAKAALPAPHGGREEQKKRRQGDISI